MNYFALRSQLALVDLPGYGQNSRKEWGEAVIHYLRERSSLRKLFLLIDCRSKLHDNDINTIQWLEELGVSYQVPSYVHIFGCKLCILVALIDIDHIKFLPL